MIFKSKYPDIKIPQAGIYQYVTSNPNKIQDEKVIYVYGVTSRSYTFGEFKHETKKFATGLQDRLEFKRGVVLAIFSPNQVDYPIVLLGTIAAGGKVTTANPIYETTKLSYQLIDSGSSVLIVHPEILEAAIEASNDAKIPASRVLLFGDKEIKEYKPYRSVLINDRIIEPIYYITEEAKSTTAYLFTVLEQPEIVSVETICESIQKFKINRIYTTPPIILKLVNDPSAQQFDLSSVDKIICSVGSLIPNIKAKVFSDDCHELGCNEPGKLWIHVPNIMKSYLNNKVATDAAAIDKDGVFNTGGIVYVDEQGSYIIVDRNKEMIKSLGFHVAPSKLESILLTHAAVSDAAVI
ncbi:hypothetical protein C2G38_2250321 [Gigaspora rosea]|uniref:AMP-dependent synthetase/ligase domain-containing protein n=1 Tax=Gigaspora rosea TaxID=44941 RepID=A0A397UVE2_9GLOM|nr:hypothetical protein C2G38_2250321 [Gigaspora rosea]